MTQDLQRYASLGLKVAITEADVRTFVTNATDQVPTDHLATFAQPDEFGQMLKACLAVRQCISFTVWGFGAGRLIALNRAQPVIAPTSPPTR
jgi:endo-1,4-beta-xylanase